MVEIARAIRRYDDSVVEKHCAYIVAPDTDPEEALVLYFIIFHLLTNWELRNLRIPSPAKDDPHVPLTSSHARQCEYLELPLRQLTRAGAHLYAKSQRLCFLGKR
jgi:hypothetical protein